MHTLRLLSPTSMLKQEWKNVSRYWLIPHYLHKAVFHGCASNQSQDTGRNFARYSPATRATVKHVSTYKTTTPKIVLQD